MKPQSIPPSKRRSRICERVFLPPVFTLLQGYTQHCFALFVYIGREEAEAGKALSILGNLDDLGYYE